jgi:O-antigen/teichoic acid export membrane protein
MWAADSLRARFARGAVWSLIGTVISQALGLATSVVTARFLGKTGFGELGMINSTVGMFGIFAGLGLGLTTTKFVAELRATDSDRAGRIIGLSSTVAVISGGLITLGLILFAPLLAASILHAPHLVTELRIGSLLLLLNALNGVQTGTLSGFEAFKSIAKANFVQGLLTFPVEIGGVIIWGLPGAVWGMVVAAGSGWLVNRTYVLRECRAVGVRVRYAGVWSERRILWSFCLPAVLANTAAGPVMWFTNTMLVSQPHGYAEMGVLNAANQWRTAILFLPGLIGQVVLPLLSSLQGTQNRHATRRILLGAIALNAVFVSPALLVIFFLKNRIMALYGPGFASRGPVLMILAIVAALVAIQAPVGNIIAAMSRMWIGALMNLFWAIVLLVSAWLFLRRGWEADGIAAAYLTAYLVLAIWTFWFAGRVLGGDGVARLPHSIATELTETTVETPPIWLPRTGLTRRSVTIAQSGHPGASKGLPLQASGTGDNSE